MKAHGVFKAGKTNAYDLCCFYCVSASREFPTFPAPCEPASSNMLKWLLETVWAVKCTHPLWAFAGDSTIAICLLRELHNKYSMKCLALESKPGKQDADSKHIKKLSFCLYHGSNDISYMNHIISTCYNTAYSCNKCLKEVFLLGQQLKTHIKICVGFLKDDTTSSSDWEPLPPGTRTVCTASAHIPERQNQAAPRSPALTRTTRSLTKIPRNRMVHQQRTSGMRTDPSPRNPTKSKYLPSTHHQIAFMHASCGTFSLQGLYSQLMHAPKAECLAV